MKSEKAEKIIEKIKAEPEKAVFFVNYSIKKSTTRALVPRIASKLNLTKIGIGTVATDDSTTAWVLADYIRKRREKVKVFFAFPIENIDDLEKL